MLFRSGQICKLGAELLECTEDEVEFDGKDVFKSKDPTQKKDVYKRQGFTPFQGFLVSLLNNASAGEYAAFAIIMANATYLEVAIILSLIHIWAVFGRSVFVQLPAQAGQISAALQKRAVFKGDSKMDQSNALKSHCIP